MAIATTSSGRSGPMDELQSVAAGVIGGAAVGRILGIGVVGTLMGAFAGAVLGLWLASPSAAVPWSDTMPNGSA